MGGWLFLAVDGRLAFRSTVSSKVCYGDVFGCGMYGDCEDQERGSGRGTVLSTCIMRMVHMGETGGGTGRPFLDEVGCVWMGLSTVSVSEETFYSWGDEM